MLYRDYASRPKDILFFDSKWQFVNNSLFPSVQAQNTLYKFKKKF